ncbi:nitrate reductase molybdenum cofactor assembly chaperone [Rhodanobacter sp. FW510-R12]|uniref:nitrate reductase molybdenum cofactor assembly chaperone n=1 Tax=unclassified Rhodanobacter TaxID=2621553 RepID=UPI0007AA4A97|nr:MULTISPECIES: nitrate reductase molybdenum cofactor assembly chaperone [unclassified Rhodanobacter]KZC16210.1 nitrate reductase molybdenum cofactor assembly chaperone [Rhodanobacter sp. FW104-R8]KZC28332.1 nitrate reductase molybdenum cofactor assembly chaperone [Rhodanobacter sp. FW510-T8]KZC32707.1 nitrate reductase molybdenum cofactor assembly chaperone [Rhodanobacter sp. FW510-R10]
MSLLKLVGVLLDYPQDELWQHRVELLEAAADPALSSECRAALIAFVQGLLDTDPLTAQDSWLQTFDRGRSMSLLLFEHIHGESRDRGQAMVDLIEAYRKQGFELAAKELPDYLPLLLEFLSQCPHDEVHDWLGHVSHIVGMLAARAGERNSPYRVLFELLLELADGKVDLEALRRRASEEPRDDTPDVMDRLWEEEMVRFGAEAPDVNCAPATRRPTPSAATSQVQP